MKLDGNAIGGLLIELFGIDLTGAMGVCGSCGAHDHVATLEVYVHAPGVVGRCRHCEAVMIKIVRGSDRVWLDMSGTGSIEIVVE
jgi:hypothetical protein